MKNTGKGTTKAKATKIALPKVVKKVVEKKVEKKVKKVEKTAEVTNQYAIFQTGGKQYQAVPGRTVAIEKVLGEAGEKITFEEVLFRKTGQDAFEFGHPFVKGATIQASIVKQAKEPKVIIFKFQRRKKRRTKTGHRQPITVLRIESV